MNYFAAVGQSRPKICSEDLSQGDRCLTLLEEVEFLHYEALLDVIRVKYDGGDTAEQ